MFLLGILLVLVFGYSFVHYLDADKTGMEKWGLSFFPGMGFVTVAMVVLDIIGVPVTLVSLYLLLISGILLLNKDYLKKIRPTNLINTLQFRIKHSRFHGLTSGNWVWYSTLTCVVLLTLSSIVICLYWPPLNYDNITAYDLMGKVIAAEGKIDNSLFDINQKPIEGTDKRLIYPPMSSGSFAFAYLHELQTSKIITACYFLFFVITFYTFLKRETNYLNGILGTFFVIIVPELFKYSTTSTVNLPFTVLMVTGIISLYFWITRQQQSDLLLGSLLLGLTAWTRSEGVVFVAVGFLFVLGIAYKNNRWKNLLWYSLCSFPFSIAWILYVEIHFNEPQAVIHLYPYFDYEKWSVVFGYLFEFLSSLQLYGITSYVFLIAILMNATSLHQHKSTYLLGLTLTSLLCITIFYYQIDYSTFSRLEGVMTFAYKRGLLCFIPLFWFYSFSNYRAKKFGEWMNLHLESGSS